MMDQETQPQRPEPPEEEQIKIIIQYGAVCPACGKGRLDYDGMLNLVCPLCGYGQGGCFT